MMQSGSILVARRREIRFTIFALATLAQFALGLFASTRAAPPGLAEEIRSSIPPDIDAIGIFYHNILASAWVFLPVFGLGWLALIIWETGLAFSALGPTAPTPFPGWLAWLSASSLPFFWLEIMAYSVAATAGTMLVLTFFLDRKRMLHEASRFALGGILYVLFLFNAAVIEPTKPVTMVLEWVSWLFVVAVGMSAIFAYSQVIGPPLRSRDWLSLTGMLAILALIPFLYVPLVLCYLMYFFWRGERRINVEQAPYPQDISI